MPQRPTTARPRAARLLVGPLLVAIAPAISLAGPIDGARVSGSIDSAGMSGLPAVSFRPSDPPTDPGADPFSLGQFAVSEPMDGAQTRYDHTPFTITYQAPGAGSPMVLRGWLDGSVGGPAPSSLAASFDQGLQPDDPAFYQPLPLPPLPASGGNPSGYLTLNRGMDRLTLDPSGDGLTSVEAQINPVATPEPTPLAFLGLAAVAWAVRRGMSGRSRR